MYANRLLEALLTQWLSSNKIESNGPQRLEKRLEGFQIREGIETLTLVEMGRTLS